MILSVSAGRCRELQEGRGQAWSWRALAAVLALASALSVAQPAAALPVPGPDDVIELPTDPEAPVLELPAGPPLRVGNSPSIERLGDAPGLVEAAIGMSEAEFADGEARVVLLARDDVFADSLAGAPLAGVHGPLLFTEGGPRDTVNPATLDEILRVLGTPTSDCNERAVIVLGGPAAVSEGVEAAIVDAGYCTHRLSGSSRVETATLVAGLIDVRPRGIDRVLIARSDDWADAATAGAYAARLELPILLTPPTGLHPAVADYLRQRRPAEVILLGGESALSAEVHAAVLPLAGMDSDPQQGPSGEPVSPVRRVAGATRQETSAAIAHQLWSALVPRSAMILNGFRREAWGLTLASSILAARRGAPQLYVSADGAAPVVTDYLGGRSLQAIIAVGSSEHVDDRLVDEVLGEMSPAVELTGVGVSHFTDERYADLPALSDSHVFIEEGVQTPTQTGAMWPACTFSSERIGGSEPTDEMVVEARITRAFDPAECRRLVEVGTVDNADLETPSNATAPQAIRRPASIEDAPTADVPEFCGPFPDCRDPLGLEADRLNSYTYAAVLEPAARVNREAVEPTSETLTYLNWQPTGGCATNGYYYGFEGRDWLVASFANILITRWNLAFFVPDSQGYCSHVFSKVHATFFNDYFLLCPPVLGGGLTYANHFPNYTEGTARGFTKVGANVTFDGNCSGALSPLVLGTPHPYRGGVAVPRDGVPGSF